MRPPTLLDTGPLVAFLNRRDRYHGWATGALDAVEPPLVTCEAVISEACYLLRRVPGGPDAVLALLERKLLDIRLDAGRESAALRVLMSRFADQPMDFADACLVRLAELHPRSRVMTLDRDFRVYRMHGRRVVPTLMPPRVD